MIILVTGGVRSGKSMFAEKYATHIHSSATYIATAIAFDEEMRQRISSHIQQRQQLTFNWRTIEEPYFLSEILLRESADDHVLLVDCLTIWLSNWLIQLNDENRMELLNDKIDELVDTIQKIKCTVILVTNEVGSGIVPESKLGRLFRDYAGVLNRKVAAISDEVYLVVAGIPVNLKQIQNQCKLNAESSHFL